jgi:DNA-binding NarL/FixJ family response regulator
LVFVFAAPVIFWSRVIRLLLYSDAPIMVAGLKSLLAGSEEFVLAAVCASVSDLLPSAAAANAHIVLLDFTSELPPALFGQIDAALLRLPVVLWVHEIPPEMAMQAVSLGLRGILRSTLAPELTLRCLQKVYAGESWFEKGLLDQCVDARKAGLTGREIQLIRLLSLGLKNKEIASTLSITEGTVKVYLSRLFQKLGVRDRFELALYGMKHPGAGAFRPASRGLARRASRRKDSAADSRLS